MFFSRATASATCSSSIPEVPGVRLGSRQSRREARGRLLLCRRGGEQRIGQYQLGPLNRVEGDGSWPGVGFDPHRPVFDTLQNTTEPLAAIQREARLDARLEAGEPFEILQAGQR